MASADPLLGPLLQDEDLVDPTRAPLPSSPSGTGPPTLSSGAVVEPTTAPAAPVGSNLNRLDSAQTAPGRLPATADSLHAHRHGSGKSTTSLARRFMNSFNARPTSFFARDPERASAAVSEAAACLSAGLHRRNFHRRQRQGQHDGAGGDGEPGTNLLPRSDDHNHDDGGGSLNCCCCFCHRACIERVIHRGAWRHLYMGIVMVNLLLALIEPSSVRTVSLAGNLPGEQKSILVLELFFVAFYALDVWLRWFAGEDVLRDMWMRTRLFTLFCIFVNVALCLFSTVEMKNFSRLLRPMLFVERLRNVRKIATSVLSTLPKVTQILLLLSFWVGFFGVAGFTLFAGVVGPQTPSGGWDDPGCNFLSGGIGYVKQMPERLASMNQTAFFACSTFSKVMPDGRPCVNYFETIWTSMMHLFILLTTANYPDVMMPMYDCTQWASLFFIVFVIVGLYFLLSLILAVVYTHFAARNAAMSARMEKKSTKDFMHAFRLMSDLTRRKKGRRAGPGGSSISFASGAGEAKRQATQTQEAEDEEEKSRGHSYRGVRRGLGSETVPSGSISLEVWTSVVREYRPTLPVEIVEALFSMHNRDGSEGMSWQQFCSAVKRTRLKIKDRKTRHRGARQQEDGDTASRRGGIQMQGRGPPARRRASIMVRAGNSLSSGRRSMRRVLRHPAFERSLDLLICVNTFLMLLRLSPGALSPASSAAVGDVMNGVLLVFVVEIVFKCYALSPRVFWENSHFNKIDFVSVLGGLVTTILVWLGVGDTDSGALSDIFLVVRMTRMLRILRMNEAFRVISATIVEIAPALLRYLGVLLALFYAFAVMGMEAFAGVLSRDCLPTSVESTHTCAQRVARLESSSYGVNNYWSNNFDTLPRALVTLFEQMVVNNWVIVMEGCVAGLGNDAPRIYFIVFWVCCVVVTMNVLVAFLIDAYQAHVAAIARRVKKWEKLRRRRLHSQGSLTSLSDSDTESGRRRSMSMATAPWLVELQMAAQRLGYDISEYNIKQEKGVGDFYQELFKS